MIKIDDLIEEIKVLKEPNAHMDAKIYGLLNHAIVKLTPPSDDFGPYDHYQFWSLDGYHFIGTEKTLHVQPITKSLDVLLEFVKNIRPDWEVRLEPRFWYEPSPHVSWKCILIKPYWNKWNPVNNDWFDNVEGEHDTRIYSIIIAFLNLLKKKNFS